MRIITFDFKKINTAKEFFNIFREKFDLPSGIPNNLDGLWDVVTGMIDLPVRIEFHNLSLNKLDKFQKIISLLEEAEDETENLLDFSYFLNK